MQFSAAAVPYVGPVCTTHRATKRGNPILTKLIDYIRYHEAVSECKSAFSFAELHSPRPKFNSGIPPSVIFLGSFLAVIKRVSKSPRRAWALFLFSPHPHPPLLPSFCIPSDSGEKSPRLPSEWPAPPSHVNRESGVSSPCFGSTPARCLFMTLVQREREEEDTWGADPNLEAKKSWEPELFCFFSLSSFNFCFFCNLRPRPQPKLFSSYWQKLKIAST